MTAVCDSYADRAENGAELVNKAGQDRPHVYTDAEDVIRDEEVNTVIIASAWESHVEIAIAAMYAGKAVAMEVGGAYTLNQCWDLVKAYEETKTPFMFLENCCFGRREMMVLNMVQQAYLARSCTAPVDTSMISGRKLHLEKRTGIIASEITCQETVTTIRHMIWDRLPKY